MKKRLNADPDSKPGCHSGIGSEKQRSGGKSRRPGQVVLERGDQSSLLLLVSSVAWGSINGFFATTVPQTCLSMPGA